MSANKYKGKVILKKTGGISKSAHEAVCLQNRENTYELRKRGVNPFEESPFKRWVGKEVWVDGNLRDKILFVEVIRDFDRADETDSSDTNSSETDSAESGD
jgi:hypothetical protein